MGSSIAYAAVAALAKFAGIAIRLFALISLSVPSAALARQQWTATGKWTVDFDDQRCFAARKYQSGTDSLIFGVAPWPMYEWTKITIEQAGSIDGIRHVHGWLAVGEGEKDHINMLVGPSANEGRVIYTFSIEGPIAAKLRTASEISLRGGSVNARIPLANLNGVFAKLDECVPLLLEHWGMPQSVQASLSSFPKPATRKYRWFSTSDYPSSAIMRGAVGVVEALLTIGMDGKVSACRPIRSSGHKDLDDSTCRVLKKRAVFAPARDRQGNAVASPYLISLNWIMP